jgi:hypothetical protein
MAVRPAKPARRAGTRIRKCGCVYRSVDVSHVKGVSGTWKRILVCNSHWAEVASRSSRQFSAPGVGTPPSG